MKKTLLTAFFAGALASCAPQSTDAYIGSFSPLGVGCALETTGTTFKFAGSLDLANAASGFVTYYLQINYNTVLSTPGVVLTNGTTLEQPDRERFVATAVHLTYILKKGGGASKTLPAVDDVPIAGTSDKANNNAKMGANIIGPKGGAALLNEVPATTSGNGYPTPDDVVELKVGISLVGALSGSGVPVTTGVVYFPINVFRSNACANGYKPATAACPANGQDAVAPVCN